MSEVLTRDLTFRPAFPDEESRAKYVEATRSPADGLTGWFLALTDGPPERIVGTIRYGCDPRMSGGTPTVDFRMTAGPGGELASREHEFLTAFVTFLGKEFRGKIRHLPLIPEGHPWEPAFANANFETRYREYHLAASVKTLAARVARNHRALQRYPSPLAAGKIVPLRECAPEPAIALLEETGLMNETSIRAIWNTGDRRLLDRDASACFMLNGEMLGVLMAADTGQDLQIMALAVRREIPGARLWVAPSLTHYLFQASARPDHAQVFFRANAETAPTIFNFARRGGGEVVADLRRWVREIG